jgi:hypothetical protein
MSSADGCGTRGGFTAEGGELTEQPITSSGNAGSTSLSGKNHPSIFCMISLYVLLGGSFLRPVLFGEQQRRGGSLLVGAPLAVF